MPNIYLNRRNNTMLLRAGSLCAGSFLILGNLKAATYTWNTPNSAPWGNPGNWNPNTGIPDAPGDIANFTFNITASQAVDVGGVTRTVGIMNVGDPAGGQSYTFNTGTIAFNNNGANAELNQLTGAGATNVNSAISLTNNLVMTNASTNSLNINGAISGTTQSVTLSGNIAFGGGAKTFTGGLFVGSGTTVGATSGNTLGAGTVTLNSGGVLLSQGNDVARSGGYVFNGGTYRGLANNSNFNNQGNVTVQAGGGTFISDITGGNTFQQYSFGTLSVGGGGTLTAKNQRTAGGGNLGGTGQITFGATTLTGNAAFETVAATAGNQVGSTQIQLNLGALNDQGTGKTITFGGVSGTLINLTSAATSLVDGTQVIVTGTSSLNLASGTSIGSLAAVNINSSTARIILNGATSFGSLAGSGAVNNGGNTLTVGNTNNLSSTFSGVLGNGAGGLTKAGTGTLELSGANTYTGTTTVNAGALRLSSSAALGAGNLTLNGGVVELANGNFTRAIGTGSGQVQLGANGGGFGAVGADRTVNITGTVVFGGTGFNATAPLILSSTNSTNLVDVTNAISLGATSVNTRVIQVADGSAAIDARVSGVLSSSGGTQSLTKSGAGTLALTNTNTYNGATLVSAGTLRIDGTGSINGSSGVTVAAGARLFYNSSTALTKTLTLSGVSATNRAVLGGNGTINSSVALDSLGDTLSPGNSPGIITLGTSQAWNSFSYDFEIKDFAGTTAGTDFDQTGIVGGLALSGGPGSYQLNVLSLDGMNAAGDAANFSETDKTFTILTTSTGITGFDAANWSIVTAGFTNNEMGTFSIAQSGNNLDLIYTAVPEPGTYAMLFSGVGVLLGLQRFRKRRS